jgi:hypothetical protein
MIFLALNRKKYEHYETFLTKIMISLKNIALTKKKIYILIKKLTLMKKTFQNDYRFNNNNKEFM